MTILRCENGHGNFDSSYGYCPECRMPLLKVPVKKWRLTPEILVVGVILYSLLCLGAGMIAGVQWAVRSSSYVGGTVTK